MTVALPTSKSTPTSDLSTKTTLVYGAPKIGKCLGGDSTLYDPLTARPISLRQFVERDEGRVITMGHAGVLREAESTRRVRNPDDMLFRLTTQTGRVIDATAEHPFLTRDGWKPLSELAPNDRVAVVAEYPSLFGQTHTDLARVKILAYLIADGSLGGICPVFTKNDDEVREDFEQAVESIGDDFVEFTNDRHIAHVRVKGRRGAGNNVVRFLRDIGLDGLRSADKFIPEFVFGLKRERLAVFLNRLFTCDGSIERKRVSYSSTSVRLVRQVQHLLLRFGIISVIRDRFLDGEPYGAELYVAGKDDILRYLDQIGVIGEKAIAAEQLRQSLYQVRCAETQLDRQGAILFDRIKSIKALHIAPVYDLTVPQTHNFVANDFIVHNSTFASQFPDALFFECEPGLSELSVYKIPTLSWPELLDACKLVAAGDHKFKTVVIDTIDNAFKFCTDHINAKNNVEYEGDLAHGKGWAFVKNEWHRVLTRLASLPYGLVLISHAVDKRIETRTGEYTKTQPSLPDRARQVVLGLVDMILYCDAVPQKDERGNVTVRRVIRTKPHPTYEAGDRTGRLPETLPLDFRAFAACFGDRKGSVNTPQTPTKE